MSGAGAAVGLILGGWLTGLDPTSGIDIEGWRLTFLINVPIGIAAALLAPASSTSPSRTRRARHPGRRHRHPRPARHRLRPHPRRHRAYGWSDPWTITSLVVGLLLLAVFVADREPRRAPAAAVPDLHQPDPRAGFAAMMLVPAAMFAMFFFLSLFIQNVMGYSPLKAGVAFLPFSVGIVVGARPPPTWSSRIDPRYIAGVGTLMAARPASGSRGSIPTPRRHLARPAAVTWARRQLLDRPAPVHRADVDRHGPDVRAAHPDRRAPPAAPRTPASAPACSTPCSRSVARSGSATSARSLQTRPRCRAGPRKGAAPQRPAAPPTRGPAAHGRRSLPAGLHRGRDPRRSWSGVVLMLAASRGRLDLPRRQARGAGHGRPARASTSADPPPASPPAGSPSPSTDSRLRRRDRAAADRSTS